MTAEICFFFEFFGIESVGLGVDFPVNVSGAVSEIVEAVLCKLYRETMVGRFV